MKRRPKLAMTWLSSCGGCEESILDLGMDRIGILDRVELIYWPIGMDGRVEDLRGLPDGGLDAAVVNGAVRTEEHVALAGLLRRKARTLVAQGSCAHLGGVYGLANLFETSELLERSYGRNVPGEDPERGGSLPRLLDRVSPLDRIVPVDFVIPGCPPVPDAVQEALERVIRGTSSAARPVLGDTRALCHTCPRVDTRKPDTQIRRLRRVHEVELDPSLCFLEQGVLCLGPATRGGCHARCIEANMPCRGCFGPLGPGEDAGAAVVAFLSGLLDAASPEVLERGMPGPVDPVGLCYRYSLPGSLLGGKGRESVS